MRPQDDIDYTTLSWVKGELDETLKQARQALEAYVEDPADTSQVRFCATYLHQVQGTLRIVELYAAAMVAEEMEHLASALLDGAVTDHDEACSVLMRGIMQLPDYLERLQTGHKDVPIVLLPLLNDLRAARGEKSVLEIELFTPDLGRELPAGASGPAQPLPEEVLRQRAELLRSQFQLALLKWFRNDDVDANLNRLTEACDRLVALTFEIEARRLFWVTAGVLEALRAKAFEPSKELKQSVGKVEREIKRLADAGERSFRADPPHELTRNLLYFVAHAPTEHGRIGELREVFRLGALLPSQDEVEHARGSLSGHNRTLLDTVSAAIKEDLLRVKDTLDLHLRNPDAEAAQLSGQAEVLDRVADTLGMLGLGVAQRVVQEQGGIIRALADGASQADEASLLDIAGALLYVESSLDEQVQHLGGSGAVAAPGTPGAAVPSSETRRVMLALVKEAQVNFTAAKQCYVAYIESSWDAEQLRDAPGLLDQVGGALRIIELPEAADYLQAIGRFTERELLDSRHVPDVIQMEALADALASVEYFLEAQAEQRPGRDRILHTARAGLEKLGYWPLPAEVTATAGAQVPAAETRDPTEALVQAIEASTEPESTMVQGHVMATVPAVDAEVAEEEFEEEFRAEHRTAPPDEPVVSGFVEPVPVATAWPASPEPVREEGPIIGGFEEASEEIDEEIREVFVEEVEEEIANLGELLPGWLEAPGDLDQLKSIRRVFHTLKGSGRLVGALALGEFSWKIENMLNRVLDHTIQPTQAVLTLVRSAHEVLPELLVALKGERSVRTDLELMKDFADRIAAGEQALYEPPTVVVEAQLPVAAVEDEIPVLVEAVEQFAVEAAGVPEEPGEERVELAVPGDPGADEATPPDAPVEVDAVVDEGRIEVAPIDTVLFDILMPEVSGHLDTVDDYLAAGRQPVSEAVVRAVHTMNGAFAMIEVPLVTELTAPLENYLKRVMADTGTPSEAGFDVLGRATQALRQVLMELDSRTPRLTPLSSLADEVATERDLLPEALGPIVPVHAPAELAEGPELTTAVSMRAIVPEPPVEHEPTVPEAVDMGGAADQALPDVESFDAMALEEALGAENIELVGVSMDALVAGMDELAAAESEHDPSTDALADALDGHGMVEPAPADADDGSGFSVPAELIELDEVVGDRPDDETGEFQIDEPDLSVLEGVEPEFVSPAAEEPVAAHVQTSDSAADDVDALIRGWLASQAGSTEPEEAASQLIETGAAPEDGIGAGEERAPEEPVDAFEMISADTFFEMISEDEPAIEDAIEAPEAEAPEAEALEAEAPEAEALEAEALEAEASEAEASEAEASEAEAFEAEAFEAEAFEAEAFEAEASEAEAPEAEAPEAEALEAEALEAEALEAEVSEAEASEAEVSEAEVSEAEVSEAEASEAEASEAEAFEAEAFEAEAFEAEASEAEAPEAEASEAEALEAEALEAEAFEAEAFEAEAFEAEAFEAEAFEAEALEAEAFEVVEFPTPAEAARQTLIAAWFVAGLDTADPDPDQALALPDMDEELLDIFVEEAADILDHSDGLMARLRDNRRDQDTVVALQRDLHTLKGGARMAGVYPIGDLGHVMESLLEIVAEGKRELPRYGIDLLEVAFDRLNQMTSRVARRQAVTQPVLLIQRVEMLARGEEPELEPIDAELLDSGEQTVIEAITPAPPQEPVAATPVAEFTPTALDEEDTSVRAPQEQIRIRADLLDRLVNYAGEVAIYRARLEQQLGLFRSNLSELEITTERLRGQLRKLEIETEAQIVARYQREAEMGGEEAFDPLELDRFSTLQQLSRALSESAADLVSLQGTLEDHTRQYETLLLQQSRVSSDLQEGLMRTRMVPFDSLVPRMRRIIRQTASELGKRAQLRVEGAQGEMDRSVLDRMTAPLEHMLRNAMAHGLESPEERSRERKPEEGSIRITFSREGSEVVIKVSDDGRGLDREAIRRKAVDRGLLLPDAVISDQALYGFILESGFSTASSISKIAGRGVGMDVVHSEIRQLGGNLSIESERGRGTVFTIRLPFTLAVTQAVFVEQGDTSFAIPIASVQGVSRIDRQELDAQLATDKPRFVYAGEDYAIHDLGRLLGQTATRAEGSIQVPLLLARSGDLRVAICVDNVIGSREIVVKPVGAQVSSIPGIFGATIMGDGRVIVILDVAPLARRFAALNVIERIESVAPVEPARHVPLVMVVDDSITMRKVTGRVLERHGYEVLTAKDGVDAVEKLVDRVPDVMLLDIEMPRMDGYELATHIRNDVRLRRIPIIMITSRTGEKHRQRAFEIGVDRYLGKPYQEADLMRNVEEILKVQRGDLG